jgi:hypothetical protein
MPTRHASPDAPLKPWRYASAPEYVEGRGIPGNLVSMKAHLLGDRRKAGLLHFIAEMSRREGGLVGFVKGFLDACPEISEPIERVTVVEDLDTGRRKKSTAMVSSRPSVEEELPERLESLCTNPKDDRWGVFRGFDDGCRLTYRRENIFPVLLDCLLSYQGRCAEAVRLGFVQTSISAKVWGALDDCLAIAHRPGREKGPVFVVQGESGTGKTMATRAWAEMHLGESVFATLSGAMNRTSLFRTLSRACGLPASYAVTSAAMQGRVEDFLVRSRPLVVIDEAHFLLPQYGRSQSRPELLDWIDTALANCGVPVALVTTPQFSELVALIHERSGWNVNQLKTRARRFVELPPKPTREDVQAVAARLLAGASPAAVDVAVNYASAVKYPLPALADLVEDAQMASERDGREAVTKADVEGALRGFAIPTAICREKLSTLPPEPDRRRGSKRRAAPSRASRGTSADDPQSGAEAPTLPLTSPRGMRPADALEMA